ncbi:DUF4232 domain-containing protein [Rhodoligotrophos defluvii]|uniref:DUF4232 domain-containing protein n=1 Tax=Rhodoligotrophos defluvii TaxID=2561934 RepID=UPI00148565A1|nr:DUF4232 domain-containing protein [Rhodoligotrophos defluvii]
MRAIPIALALGIVAAVTAGARAQDQAPAGPCSGLNLKIDSGGQDAGEGKNAFAYKITNIGAKPCTLDGHPRVELLDPKGQPVQDMPVEETTASAVVSAEDSAGPVTVPPGGEAFFAVEFPTGGGSADCRNAVELRATLPGTSMPATFAGSFTACGGPVRVTQINPGASPLE